LKVLIDTNVIVDNLARRDEYGESLRILILCEAGMLEGVISAITVLDVMCILRIYLSRAKARETVQTITRIVEVVSVLPVDISTAFSSDIIDFEDAVQAACARRVNADYIITRNTKDFQKSSVPAITPRDMLNLLISIDKEDDSSKS